MNAVLSQHVYGPSRLALALSPSYTINLGWPPLYGTLNPESCRSDTDLRSNLRRIFRCRELPDSMRSSPQLRVFVRQYCSIRLYHWRRKLRMFGFRLRRLYRETSSRDIYGLRECARRQTKHPCNSHSSCNLSRLSDSNNSIPHPDQWQHPFI